MKGFIEVTTASLGELLININWIEEVCNRTIYLGFKDGEGQDFVHCIESYEQIVEKIKEATA